MPSQRVVKTPDNVTHYFPADATDQEISEALNTPPATARGKPERSWTDTATDVAVGAAKGAAHTALDLGQAVRMIPGVGATTDAIGNAIGGVASKALYGTATPPVSGDTALSQARDQTAYTNAPQMAGGALETAAELALPVTKAAEAVPSVERAGKAFQSVMSAAKNVPVDVNGPGQVALRIQQLSERGGSMPMAVRKLLARITEPNGAPFTYEEARDFASNISRLSANEYGRLTPVVAREVANLRVALNGAVADAAKQAGKLGEYRSAMREYAHAMRIRGAIESVAEGAKKSVPYATAAGAGYWLTQKVRGMIAGE